MGEARPSSASSGGAVSSGRALAAIVAGWLVPGAGHAVLGRVRRAVFFFLLVGTSFTLGLAHDGRLALYSSKESFLTGLQVIANVGVGPADVVARMGVYGGAAYRLPEASDPSYQRLETTFRDRQRAAVSAYGTAYLWTAGLMNLLLLLDVWDIATGRKD
jgi:hypothetical protein